MQVDKYQDKDGKNRNYTYVLVEDLEYLERKKEDTQEAKQEEKNEFDYDSSDLPF